MRTAGAPVHRHHVQPGRREPDLLGGELLQLAELGLQRPRAPDDDAVGGVAAEQRGDPFELLVGEQPLAQVVAGVADLGQHPQRGGDPREGRRGPEHVDDPFQDRIVEGQVAGAALLLARADHQRQHVGERLGAEAAGDVQAGQVVRQHPHQGVVAAVGGQPQQVVRDGALGQVDDGEAGTGGEAGGAHGGDGGGPADERAADDVDPVDAGRDGDRVPLALGLVRAAAALPVAVGVGVLALGGLAFPVAGGAGPLAEGALGGQPGPDGALVLPEQVAGDPQDDRAGEQRHQRERPGEHARQAAGQEEHVADDAAEGRDPQRPGGHVLAGPADGRRHGAAFRGRGWGGRRRSRVGMHLCVAPADIDAVGLGEPRHRGPARHVRHVERPLGVAEW